MIAVVAAHPVWLAVERTADVAATDTMNEPPVWQVKAIGRLTSRLVIAPDAKLIVVLLETGVIATWRPAPWCQMPFGASWMMMLSGDTPASLWQSTFSSAKAPGPTGNWEPALALTAPALPAPGPQLFVAPAGETKIGITPAVAIATAARTEPNLGRRMPGAPYLDWPATPPAMFGMPRNDTPNRFYSARRRL